MVNVLVAWGINAVLIALGSSAKATLIPNEYEDAHYGLSLAVAVPCVLRTRFTKAQGDYRGYSICASTYGIGISSVLRQNYKFRLDSPLSQPMDLSCQLLEAKIPVALC